MTILVAGTFKTSKYRKAIPLRVMLAVIVRAVKETWEKDDLTKAWLDEMIAACLAGEIRFDHRPALAERDYDTDARDFIPPQHAPDKIDAILAENHNVRTFGAYGEPQRGDLTNRARVKEIANNHEDFKERQAAKAGLTHERRTVPKRKKSPPKRKIANRGFPKGGPKRKIQSRGFR